jgi:hypothetical protein
VTQVYDQQQTPYRCEEHPEEYKEDKFRSMYMQFQLQFYWWGCPKKKKTSQT